MHVYIPLIYSTSLLSIPGRDTIFIFSLASMGSTQPPPIHWLPGAVSPEVKWLGCKTGHSPPSSADIKNGGAIPPLPHTSSFQHMENFTFTFSVVQVTIIFEFVHSFCMFCLWTLLYFCLLICHSCLVTFSGGVTLWLYQYSVLFNDACQCHRLYRVGC
jgi:hypothetical protein